MTEVEGASLSIVGPSHVEVGEEAVFTVDAEGVSSWVWTLPHGRYVTDAAEISVTANSSGTGEVVLRGRGPAGQELEVRHSIQVNPAP